MNVRISYDFEFLTGIWMNDELLYNKYNLKIYLITGTENNYDQGIALERIRYFLTKVSQSVFVNEEETDIIERFLDLGVPVMTLPGEAYDQFVQLALFLKFNAITEKNLVVTDMELSSMLGDNVVYLHCDEEPIGPFQTDDWWYKPTLEQFNKKLLGKDDNIVRIQRTPDWAEVDLSWEADYNPEQNVEFELEIDNSVTFDKDEN